MNIPADFAPLLAPMMDILDAAEVEVAKVMREYKSVDAKSIMPMLNKCAMAMMESEHVDAEFAVALVKVSMFKMSVKLDVECPYSEEENMDNIGNVVEGYARCVLKVKDA